MSSFHLSPPACRVSGHALVAIALSLAVFVLGVRFGSRTAGGSDSYGYVSQADLWLRGNLHVDQPWIARFAWPDVDAVFAPLGYAPATRPHAIVPTYPPGLPLLMAAFSAVGGKAARYLVVPLMGALAVWLTFRLGRKAVRETGALLAALLLASSPAFLFHLLQPMSDVPATTAWLAAFVLTLGPPRRPILAGLAAAVAILIRPSLAPLALVAATGPLVVIRLKADSTGPSTSAREIRLQTDSPALRDVAWFALGVLPGILFYAAFNAALYGGPLTSGYGRFGELFTLTDPAGTLLHYLRQLAETQTPFIALALPGCLLVGRERDEAPRRLGLLLSTGILVVLGVYAFYTRFEDWTYLRYFLPAYPAILILSIGGLQWVIRGGRKAEGGGQVAEGAVTILVCLLVAGTTWRIAMQRDVFGDARRESRYHRVAESVARLTPPNAAILSIQHSGTLRYYASRLTVRYDFLAPDALDRAVEDLADAGYRPYILLEGAELDAFRARFGAASPNGQLDRSPIARLWPRPPVFLYDAQDTGLPPQSGASR